MDDAKINPLRYQDEPDKASMLAYATPAPVGGSPLAAGVWITIAGLAMIFFGGCFMIGVLMSGSIPAATSVQTLLYALAFACFGAGAFLLFLGIRKLLSVGTYSA